jgi:hypothetical protein
VSDIGLSSIDHDTAEMGCTANVHIVTAGGDRPVAIRYSLKPSLDEDGSILIGGNWKEAQTILVNSLTLGQFFGTDEAANPNLVGE